VYLFGGCLLSNKDVLDENQMFTHCVQKNQSSKKRSCLEIKLLCARDMEALDKNVALVLWGEDENGEDDVAMFSGVLVSEEGRYYLRMSNGKAPEIYSEWLDRIKPTPDKMKEFFLECEYHLVLSVGNVEEAGSDMKSFGGLKWPE